MFKIWTMCVVLLKAHLRRLDLCSLVYVTVWSAVDYRAGAGARVWLVNLEGCNCGPGQNPPFTGSSPVSGYEARNVTACMQSQSHLFCTEVSSYNEFTVNQALIFIMKMQCEHSEPGYYRPKGGMVLVIVVAPAMAMHRGCCSI